MIAKDPFVVFSDVKPLIEEYCIYVQKENI
jgi:hypothetical protein